MIISLVILLAACGVWVAMVPRVSTVPREVVDPAGIAREVGAQRNWDVALPHGLPSDWVATNVRLLQFEGEPVTWHAGYQAPSGAFVSVEQTTNGSDRWLRRQTGYGAPTGQVEVGGVIWTKLANEDKGQRSLVRVGPLSGLDTVVTGKAGWPELQEYAAALRPTR